MVDAAVLHYIIGNEDRKLHWVRYKKKKTLVGLEGMIVVIDNGKR